MQRSVVAIGNVTSYEADDRHGGPAHTHYVDLGDLEEFLIRQRFSRYFVDYFVTPLVAAVRRCASGGALRYPARVPLFTVMDVSGTRPTEKHLRGRPESAEYQSRTPYFIPRPVTSAGR
ncbi:hypothetical protein H7J11_02460 [Mycobacterium bourgelatii]|nr:hypothetical protein [Mycobacterium bourgelatii]